MKITRTTRSLALSAAALLLGSAQAAAQLQIEPNFQIPSRTSTTQYKPVSMYNIWATGQDSVTTTGRSAAQPFLATAPKLTSVVANLSTTGTVTVYLKSGNEILGSAPAVKSGQQATAAFDPPVTITPGQMYSVSIVSTTNATFHGHKDEEAYLWDCGAGSADLNLRITGGVPLRAVLSSSPVASVPQQRALLILLENGGIAQSTIPILNDICPKITFSTCGDLSFELKKDEHIADLIARVFDKIGSNLQCLDPKNWKQHTVRFDGWVEGVTDYILEEVAKAVSNATTNTSAYRYDKVVLMEDEQFTAPKVLAKLKQLAPDYVIDVHVLAHGGTNVIIGHNHQALGQANFFREIAAHNIRSAQPIRLRAVYQMNCISGTLVKEWRECGADVVNGTRETYLNCMPTQYFGFLKHWLSGEQFDESVRRGYEEAKPYMSIVFLDRPATIEESRMVIHGDQNLRITR